MARHLKLKRQVAGGTLLGVGLGGVLNGILLNQIFQLNHTLSGTVFTDSVLNIQFNMFWDGIVMAGAWLIAIIGLSVLWSGVKKESAHSTAVLSGSLIAGWGVFNILEGLICHQILGIHHTVQLAPSSLQLYWDLAYIGLGLAFLVVGSLVTRQGRTRAEVRAARSAAATRHAA